MDNADSPSSKPKLLDTLEECAHQSIAQLGRLQSRQAINENVCRFINKQIVRNFQYPNFQRALRIDYDDAILELAAVLVPYMTNWIQLIAEPIVLKSIPDLQRYIWDLYIQTLDTVIDEFPNVSALAA